MTKREEFEQFKKMLAKKAEKLGELSYPSQELDELLKEIEQDKLTLKWLSQEATVEWLNNK